MKTNPGKVSLITTMVMILTLALAGYARAQANVFTFLKVADTSTLVPGQGGAFTSFGAPAISDGNFAFKGSTVGLEGIYTGTLGTPGVSRLADTSPVPGQSSFTQFGVPSISGNTVAFQSFGLYGIFTGTVGTTGVSLVADSNTPSSPTRNFQSFGPIVTISGSNVAFTGTDGQAGGIYTAGIAGISNPVGFTTLIPDRPPNTKFGLFGEAISISGNTVAFYGGENGGPFGIYVGTSNSVSRVADTSTSVPGGSGSFTDFAQPSISGDNIAFVGKYSGFQGIYMATTGMSGVNRVADYATAVPDQIGRFFTGFENPVISENTVAFLGRYAGPSQGIFVSLDNTLLSVIDTGDTLFGSTVTSLTFGQFGFDGSEIAFGYKLANGFSGIAVTSVVPEPTTMALVFSAALLGLGLMRCRRDCGQLLRSFFQTTPKGLAGKGKLFRPWLWLLALAAVSYSARAGETFTNIADDSGEIYGFESTPKINNSGTVALVVSYDRAGAFDPVVESVVTGKGMGLTELYRNGGTVEYGGHTSTVNYLMGSSINAAGTVAFSYTVNDTYYSAILTANTSAVTHIVDNEDAVFGIPGSFIQFGTPAINDAGTVAFWGSVTGGSGIYTKNAASAGGIVDQAVSPAYYGPVPDINNSGVVAGAKRDASGIDFIFTGVSASGITPVASTAADALDYSLNSSPSINNRGGVAYVGNARAGGSKNIYLQSPDGTTFLYASTGPVNGVDSPFLSLGDHASISDSGVAYWARLNSPGNHGVILRQSSLSDPLDVVVEIGDALFGSTVIALSTRPELNDNGEIAFSYRLANGVTGIAVASPGKILRQISTGKGYDQIRLRSDQGSGNVASLRGGQAGDDRAVKMEFVPRTEAPPGAFATFVGDAFTLTGTGDDVFVLQLTYTDEDLAAAGVVDEAGLYIGWLDPVSLVGKNAVDGNNPPGGESFFGMSYDMYLAMQGGVFRLGDYGNHPESNTIWAVLNHNSLFVVASVPEPTSSYLLLAGMGLLLAFKFAGRFGRHSPLIHG